MSSKLFSFSRPLPEPFDKVKRKVKVSSKYGDGTESTLCCTVAKAVLAYFKCKYGVEPGAVPKAWRNISLIPALMTTIWPSTSLLLAPSLPVSITRIRR